MTIKAFGQATPSQVLSLENAINAPLPADYKDFLLKTNGAELHNALINPEDLNEEIALDVLFGFQSDENLDILFWLNEYKDEIPERSLLIGSDPGSNLILMIPHGEDQGLYYWDHTHFFPDSSEENGNTYYICDSFQSLLEIIS